MVDKGKNGADKTGRSTTTKANGGTRSSPPRVGGNGTGEAKDIKAKSASEAKKKATESNANKQCASPVIEKNKIKQTAATRTAR
ncbi:hypothetical protein BH20ACI2_BH20ACI2_26810 [soil metagenome]